MISKIEIEGKSFREFLITKNCPDYNGYYITPERSSILKSTESNRWRERLLLNRTHYLNSPYYFDQNSAIGDGAFNDSQNILIAYGPLDIPTQPTIFSDLIQDRRFTPLIMRTLDDKLEESIFNNLANDTAFASNWRKRSSEKARIIYSDKFGLFGTPYDLFGVEHSTKNESYFKLYNYLEQFRGDSAWLETNALDTELNLKREWEVKATIFGIPTEVTVATGKLFYNEKIFYEKRPDYIKECYPYYPYIMASRPINESDFILGNRKIVIQRKGLEEKTALSVNNPYYIETPTITEQNEDSSGTTTTYETRKIIGENSIDELNYGNFNIKKSHLLHNRLGLYWGEENNDENFPYKYSVLNKGGVKIAPTEEDIKNSSEQLNVRNFMISIENLAWKDYEKIIPKSDKPSSDPTTIGENYLDSYEKGPFGGRVMWFAPYNLTVQDNPSVRFNAQSFIGRPEPIYTYQESTRNGTLSFRMLIDHSSIRNLANTNLGLFNEEERKKFLRRLESYDIEGLVEEPESIRNPTEGNTYKRIINNNVFSDVKQSEDEWLSITQRKMVDNFHPAFHSYTPESYSSRLTFLHQLTKPGPTPFNNQIYNLNFGRPPICILRIGDLYYTKIVPNQLTLSYVDKAGWDMNYYGAGMIPMAVDITLGFDFIGGSSLSGPINELQNALSFNFFANTSIYDHRAKEHITTVGTELIPEVAVVDNKTENNTGESIIYDLIENGAAIEDERRVEDIFLQPRESTG